MKILKVFPHKIRRGTLIKIEIWKMYYSIQIQLCYKVQFAESIKEKEKCENQ